jgi:hypothetical protein
MTTELIERWQKIRGLDKFHAMLELKFLGDILASNKRASARTEAKRNHNKTIITEESANGNQAKNHYPAY